MFDLTSLFEPLNPEYVKRGKVEVATMYNDGENTVALIRLFPWSQIGDHEHQKDREVYFNARTGEVINPCDIGGTHGLKNDSDEYLLVFSVKTTKHVPIKEFVEVCKKSLFL